jgi:uncharacterized protein YbbC (DUF1343 family)
MQYTTILRSLVYFILCFSISSCSGKNKPEIETANEPVVLFQNENIVVGAERIEEYLPLLKDKVVGLVVNQTSMVGKTHLADTLIALQVNVKSIFAPEHGFRGTADAGETVKNGIDTKTGLPIISLYGSNKKPTAEQLKGIDVLIFDIQDVGARFYTYISTMHYVMEAGAQNHVPVIILDRPNPNGHYVDGPILESANTSFVGMHPVPIVHGMTVGEYAQMVNGEGWLFNGIQCELTVITCEGYDHTVFYELPIAPSPNLPNMYAIYLYPTLCLFEGTDISVGRGTDLQFQVVGSPNISDRRLGPEFFNMKAGYKFVPVPKPGAKNPPHEGKECWGFDLSKRSDIEALQAVKEIDYLYLQAVYQLHDKKDIFFNDFFIKLAGTPTLKAMIEDPSKTGATLMKYAADLTQFKKVRSQYLLYKDFE